MALKRTLLASAACCCGLPAVALDLPSTTAPGRTLPSRGDGEIAIDRAKRSLPFGKADGSVGAGALLNALPAGRKAVELERADDLKLMPAGGTAVNTLAALLGRTVYVTDFLAPGTTDITAALGRAVARLGARGGKILLPSSGTGYALTAKIQFPSNILVEGDGRYAAVVTSNFDGDVFAFGDGSATVENAGLRNVTFRSTTTRTAGAFVALRGAYNFRGEAITCDVNTYVCIDVLDGPNAFKVHLDNVLAIGSPYVGIRVGFGGAADKTMPADLFITNPVTSGARRAGIELMNGNGVQMRGGDHIKADVALLIDPGNGQRVGAIQAADTYLDTSTNAGLKIAPMGTGAVADSTFTGMWAATNGHSTGAPGVLVQGSAASVRSLSFNGLRSLNNGGEGLRVEGGAFIDVTAPQIGFNSLTSAGASSGIYFGAGVSTWSVVGGRSGAGTQFTQANRQKYGLEIAAGAGDAITVVGVDLTGNRVGALSNGATGANQIVIARGAPYGLAGANVGIGTTTPSSPLSVVGASRAFTAAISGGATAQFGLGTGAATDDGLLIGTLAGAYSWLQAAKPGSIVRPLYLQPNGGALLLGKPSPAASEARDLTYLPVVAGPPTGAPAAIAGMAATVIDGTNNKICFHTNAAWHCVGP